MKIPSAFQGRQTAEFVPALSDVDSVVAEAPVHASSGDDGLLDSYHYSDFFSACHFFNSLIRRFRWDL